jgi:hypothetical protein
MDGLGNCNNPNIKQTSSADDGTNVISEYKMNIYITFSQPVTPSSVTITGDVSDN